MLIRLSVCVWTLAIYSSRTTKQIFMEIGIAEFIKFVDMLQFSWSQTSNELFYIKPFFVYVAINLSELKVLIRE